MTSFPCEFVGTGVTKFRFLSNVRPIAPLDTRVTSLQCEFVGDPVTWYRFLSNLRLISPIGTRVTSLSGVSFPGSVV